MESLQEESCPPTGLEDFLQEEAEKCLLLMYYGKDLEGQWGGRQSVAGEEKLPPPADRLPPPVPDPVRVGGWASHWTVRSCSPICVRLFRWSVF